MNKGLVQVYTGSGKGKTTAALGLALRAVGQGLRVCIVQFMKPTDFETGEKIAAQRLEPALQIKQFGNSSVWGKGRPKEGITSDMKQAARNALDFAINNADQGHYDIMVLDEINVALNQDLLKLDDVLAFVKGKPENIELILTGREAPQQLIEAADLVTEMREIKHPYQSGIKARKGIEY